MPLTLNCPYCGQLAVLPNSAIHRQARCTSCQSTYAVQDALQRSRRPNFPAVDNRMSLHEKLVLGVGLSALALIAITFCIYWFGMRDTWETDNYLPITRQCDAVLAAIGSSDDDAAAQAYADLTTFVEGHVIESPSLIKRLETVDNAMSPVLARIERERREREAQAEREKREREIEEAKAKYEKWRRENEVKSASDATYKGFTESELEKVYEKLRSEGYSAEEAILTVKAMLDYPDTREIVRKWVQDH